MPCAVRSAPARGRWLLEHVGKSARLAGRQPAPVCGGKKPRNTTGIPTFLAATAEHHPTASQASRFADTLLLIALLCATGLASGCATMFNRSPGDVSVTTVPDGADVQVDELAVSCQTPCELEVTPDRYELHVSKAGYKPETVQLVKRMATSFWINFVTGPYCVIGMGIDWLTGSISKISPAEVRLKLVPLAGTKPEAKKEPADDGDDGDDEPEPPAQGEPEKPRAAPALEGDQLPAPPAPEPEATQAAPPVAEPDAKAAPEAAPDDYKDRQIENYYGELPAKKRAVVKAHLEAILREMQQNGERADIDEAVRIEKFRYP